ncbi:MAG TPA: fibrobacter succinogenes major paralogous domain-containing protein [Tenuifilaceae bacterium]|nr:fibrobacter succinogenes major paralogous domain-containing protein [Tenuifilaceae bacterium]HOZ14780.1 fibrobacter succinogenes major paralogous domain-containing protein [Tenuifilaceae bacterium]HPI45370.1 fibrobacter succinogenes major paralogous domain-containing protein [Tenuifilaceae bacterium]
MKNSIIILCKKGILLTLACLTLTNCKKELESTPLTVTDIDGNVYGTVKIGEQIWMTENLKVTRYRNGDYVSTYLSNFEWSNVLAGAMCDYDDKPDSSAIYGKLYNGYTVSDSRNICPEGWHIPTKTELETLVNYLGGPSNASIKLKEKGTLHWIYGNSNATNESNFTALPGGNRVASGSYMDINASGFWWSSSTSTTDKMYCLQLIDNTDAAFIYEIDNNYGFSIRCIKDK